MLQQKREMGSRQIPRGGSRSSSDPSATNWTSAMESYFIDLLLDQVHRGNRMGYTFNKQAWNEMLALFNAKFRYPYDISLLKTRYTVLWMQFNNIKNLLDQNGFSWDETRQMVVASNHVWDAYIKEHPNAQAYRSKTLVNIKDLCLIYGHRSADGRYSLSSHDMDFDDDVQVVNTGNGIAARTTAPPTGECPDTDWMVAMDCYLVKLMLGQLKNGNMIRNTFSRKAWNQMLKLFNKKFDAQYDKSFLKHRYVKLGSYYSDVKDLLELKEFSWDEKQQRIVAGDYVWDNYIKEHPRAGSYRNKTLVNYRDLGLIYGNAVCNGHCSRVQEGRENEDHSSDGGEYVGGNWTSHMDCYLADLLLNQALKGNKTSCDFTCEAWCEIVAMFHAKFGSHYTKDALRNRYQYLERQYNDWKVLVKQPGFAWDGKREMVTAKDEVWNSYTKVHPDSLSYRNNFFPIYHKLCSIYGLEISEGRCNHSACSVDHTSSGPISVVGGDEVIQDCAVGGCSRTDWTPSMNRYLIDLMLEEVRRGNKIDYACNTQAWIDMHILFRERFGVQFDKEYLKSCCKDLEKLYHDLRTLIAEGGFSWDETQQMVTALDGVWDAYIKEHPHANSYRNHRQPNYNDLCLIYGSSDTDLACNLLPNQNIGYNGYSIKFQNSYWRSHWTPPMDRYFMDLMLEEVRNGNMVDQKFDKLTWRNTVAKFSAEFGSQYGNDDLKNRYVTLRKRFDDVKILLNQSGFTWDETQQMITADGRLWDAYVKEHPDLKAYRNRTLPNFNDLYLIYGNNNCGQNQNYSDSTRDAKDNGLTIDVGKYNQSPANDESMRIAWTVKMDHYLIGLLLEQLKRGSKIGGAFSRKSWSRITASFNKEFGQLCDSDALENRYVGLMRVFKDVRYLLNQNGISGDEIQHMSRANDVWEAYFEVYPDAIAFGETIRNNYNDLCLLFGNINQNRMPGCVRIKLKTSNKNFGMETDNITGDLQPSARELKLPDERKRQKSEAVLTSSNARKVQKTLLGEMHEDLGEKKDNSIERIVAALQTVPDLDDELFLEACLLLEDERKARMFVAMDATARRRWLLKRLH